MHNPINKKDLDHVLTLLGSSAGGELVKLINRESTYTFMAYLSQSGTNAPTMDILYSNLETNPTIEYTGPGTYNITHPLINLTNTIVTINKDQVNLGNYAGAFVKQPGIISVITYDNAFTPGDGALNITPIKVQIWNNPLTVPLV